MSAPGSYLLFDPGRSMGWASCLYGGDDLQYGTLRYKQSLPGEAYSRFLFDLTAKIRTLPDVQVGMELMTIVAHEDDNGKAGVNAEQVQFSSGWPVLAQTLCFRLNARPPEMIAIQSWRSKTHGKTRAPEGLSGTEKGRVWLKKQAFDFCHAEGWEPDSDNAAEALCMLVYMRILHEPSFAFDRGQSFEQERLFA